MSGNHNPCLEHREAVAGLVLGVLPPQEAAGLREHLDGCVGCRAFHESLERQEREIEAALGDLAQALQPPAEPLATVVGQAPAAPTEPARRTRTPGPWRGRRATTAIALGLVALVGGLSLLSWHGGRDPIASTAQAAYSDMLRQIVRATSVRYIRTLHIEGGSSIVTEQMLLEGGRARMISSDNTITIDSYGTGDQLRLDPTRKIAIRVHGMQSDRARRMDWPDWIRALHERAGRCEGKQLLEGRVVDVYRVDQPYQKITIWTDPRTHLPLRVETVALPATDKDIRVPYMALAESDFWPEAHRNRYAGGPNRDWQMGQTSRGVHNQKCTTVLSDFAWNIPMDESLFSLALPEGYKLQQTVSFGDSIAGEAALVEALRFWAETSDGRFPDDINMLGDAKPNLVRRYRTVGRPRQAFEQALPMMQTILHGMLFAQKLKVEDNWHYAGEQVRLGQADKPLAWWLDMETLRWRVVYGDLTARNLPRDQPPATPHRQASPEPPQSSR